MLLDAAEKLITPFNRENLRQALAILYQAESYRQLADYVLDASDPSDDRYDDFLRGYVAMSGLSDELFIVLAHLEEQDEGVNNLQQAQNNLNLPAAFSLFWDALFTKCERQYGAENYSQFLEALLSHLSAGFEPQRLLIAGHITISGGHQIVADKHFRLASGKHATPQEAGQYLIIDAAWPLASAEALKTGLGSVF